MTKDLAQSMYDGAPCRIADRNWSMAVDGVLASQTSSAYHLYCHLTNGDDRIERLEVHVKTPET